MGPAIRTELLHIFETTEWSAVWEEEASALAAHALESGRILFFPNLRFELSNGERRFLSPKWSSGNAKNISYDPGKDEVRGTKASGADRADLAGLMRRYSQHAKELVTCACRGYESAIQSGRTSFRPVEIVGRESSVTKDDTRLHVDAFASQPVQGSRILRVFSNIDPAGKPRVWEVGEDFESVVANFSSRIPRPVPGSAWLMHRLGVTKSRRSHYDHIMLHLHDAMKRDDDYQRKAAKTRVEFPSGSTWIVYTDRVSHAALAGQFVLEQTFYLPVGAMQREEYAPLRVLERNFHAPLT